MDIINTIENLQRVPEGLHWFCPRANVNDDGTFFTEDLPAQDSEEDAVAIKERSKRVEDALARKRQVLKALQIFAFDGTDAAPYQKWLENCLGERMSTCDICIREFHRGRRELRQKLEENYDEEEVAAFLERVDEMNLKRIQNGLARATETLRNASKESRGVTSIDRECLFSIFESLNSVAVLANEDFLISHFDEPFRLIQTNRRLKLNNFIPAMGHFLFHNQPDRVVWATSSWSRIKRCITANEFEWSVREPLSVAMNRVQLSNLDKVFLPTFWTGVRNIVRRMDRELIAHSLRAMDLDICRMALDHLQVDGDSFIPLLGTMEHILSTSAKDFWESMGATPPNAWIEQFFISPALNTQVRELTSEAEKDPSVLDCLFNWILPFLVSITAVNRPSACRGIVDQLFSRFHADSFLPPVITYCSKLGLRALADTLRALNEDRSFSDLRVPASEALDLVVRHVSKMTTWINRVPALSELGLNVIQQALALDCKCLISDKNYQVTNQQPPASLCTSHSQIWRHATKTLESDNMLAVNHLLIGVKGLIGHEPLMLRPSKPLSKEMQRFNDTYESIHKSIVGYLERIHDFDLSTIQSMFDDQAQASAFISLLFSSHAEVRSTAIEILKTVSGQTSRQEAISSTLKSHFEDTLHSFAAFYRRISILKTFAPIQSVLKLSKDVLDALCDPADGILRARTLSAKEARAVENFWRALWEELNCIFTSTESWSNAGHDKHKMMKFCQDVMEFAGLVFDQFAVFAMAIAAGAEEGDKSREISKRLAVQPKSTMENIVKWLRLRDEFLLRKSSELVCSILRRLKQSETKVDEPTLYYIEKLITGVMRSVLSATQKAELHSALEEHVGRVIIIEEEQPMSTEIKKGTIDLDKWSAKARTNKETLKPPTTLRPLGKSAEPRPPKIDVADFRRKREEEMAAKKKRDAEIVAKAKGAVLGSMANDQILPKGAGMMVSSDESESEPEDALDLELFGGRKPTKPSTDVRGEGKISIVNARPQGPVKKQRLVRSTKDMRARLAPDLSPLHKSILGWQYFHDGPYPPNTDPKQYAAVLNTFRDPTDYQNTFRPLLTLEAWNGFLKAKEDNSARPYEIKVENRATVDAFIEISSTMSYEHGKEVSEGDVVLLSKASSPANDSSQPHALSRVFRITRKKAFLEVLYRALPGSPLVPSCVPNAKLFGLKITSIVPLEREYGALLGLQYYDLCDEISKAKPSPLLNYGDEKLNAFIRNYNLNRAQAKAVKSAIDNDAFTLVQGPPGSGKTKTIVAIVGALLSETLKLQGTLISQPKSKNQGQQQQAPAKKLLVCAPSNAAVDELVMRFKSGVRLMSGEDRKLNIVRLGRSDAINTNVQDVTLEELVNKRLNVQTDNNKAREETQKIMKQHQEISAKLAEAHRMLDAALENKQDAQQHRKDVADYRRSKALLGQRIDDAKDNEGAERRQMDVNRRRAQQEVVESANVICATLSGSGHEMFQNLNVEFETVIIDEAAQCVELSALIPLKYGCAKCVLVGDPQQLPPTVFSKEAARFKYQQSLFVRMQSNHPKDVHLLDTQYRMHPDISAFPSKAFYDGKLLDGPDMASLRARPWHGTELLGPYRFFDVQGQQQAAIRGHSLVNHAEIKVAMQLYHRLSTDFGDFKGKIGVITPYKSQLSELKAQFSRQFGSSITDIIEFHTTDAFQGRESEVIIFSCVRASPSGGIGFLQDIRRMNVGLTRAKSSLWVLGNSQSLMRGEFWNKLIEHSRLTKCLTGGNFDVILQRPSKIIKAVENGTIHDSKPNGKIMNDVAKENIRHNYTSAMDVDIPVTIQTKRDSKPTDEIKSKSKPEMMVKREHVNRKIPDGRSASELLHKRKPARDGETNSKQTSSSVSSSSSSDGTDDDDDDDDVDMTDAVAQAMVPSKINTTAASARPTGIKKVYRKPASSGMFMPKKKKPRI